MFMFLYEPSFIHEGMRQGEMVIRGRDWWKRTGRTSLPIPSAGIIPSLRADRLRTLAIVGGVVYKVTDRDKRDRWR